MTINTIHPEANFRRQFVFAGPSDYLRSGNTLLLCLNAEGLLLHHFFLNQSGSLLGSSIVMQACVTLAKGIGASHLIRIQTHPAYEADPLQINTPATKGLYEAVKLHNLSLTEVVLPNIL